MQHRICWIVLTHTYPQHAHGEVKDGFVWNVSESVGVVSVRTGPIGSQCQACSSEQPLSDGVSENEGVICCVMKALLN